MRFDLEAFWQRTFLFSAFLFVCSKTADMTYKFKKSLLFRKNCFTFGNLYDIILYEECRAVGYFVRHIVKE